MPERLGKKILTSEFAASEKIPLPLHDIKGMLFESQDLLRAIDDICVIYPLTSVT